MDIREKVIEIRNTRDKQAYVAYFEAHPKELDQLIQLIEDLEEYPLKEYSSWALVHIAKARNPHVQKYYSTLVDVLFKTTDQTVLRNVVNVISQLELTDYRESDFIDLLIAFVQDYENKVALQVYSIYQLIKFVKKYPDLKTEIGEIITMNTQGKSAAYHVAKRTYFEAIEKI